MPKWILTVINRGCEIKWVKRRSEEELITVENYFYDRAFLRESFYTNLIKINFL